MLGLGFKCRKTQRSANRATSDDRVGRHTLMDRKIQRTCEIGSSPDVHPLWNRKIATIQLIRSSSTIPVRTMPAEKTREKLTPRTTRQEVVRSATPALAHTEGRRNRGHNRRTQSKDKKVTHQRTHLVLLYRLPVLLTETE